jgi:hypothetical protein
MGEGADPKPPRQWGRRIWIGSFVLIVLLGFWW